MGQDLLDAQAQLLVPWARQPERLVPRGQLHRTGPGVARQGHTQHLHQDAGDVVLRLLLGQPQRVDLHAVAEALELGVGDAVALRADAVPQLDERPHLGDLLDEPDPGVDEERHAPDDLREVLLGDLAPFLHGIEHRDRVGEREGQFLHRRRPGLLQVVAADVQRVEPWQVRDGVGDHVGGQAHRRFGRERVGPPREVLLQDVVLGRPGELADVRALLLGHRDVERQQPHGGGVDRHGGVHLLERDLVEQGAHVVDRADRHADLADLADREHVVRVVAGLGRQVEGDRQPRLALGEVGAVQLIGRRGRGVPGVGPDHPGAVALRQPTVVGSVLVRLGCTHDSHLPGVDDRPRVPGARRRPRRRDAPSDPTGTVRPSSRRVASRGFVP